AGELVGINTAILSRSGGSMGIGFAIPTNMATPIVDQLRDSGKVSRGWLGVRIQDLDADLRAALALGDTDGVLVSDVEKGGPADRGGLRSGDVVTHIGTDAIGSTGQLRNLIAAAGPEAKVELTVVREKKTIKLNIDLGALPDDGEILPPNKGGDSGAPDVDGLSLQTLDDNLRARLGVEKDVKGVVITRILPDSKAAQAKLRPGDIILQINQKPVATSEEAQKRYKAETGPK